MPFGLGKVQILESKLDIYEELSKEMLAKLERAVSSIQDNSNKVAIILERHESRLDENEKNGTAILKLIEKVEDKIGDVEEKVNNLQKFRWVAMGVAVALITLFEIPKVVERTLTPAPKTSTMNMVYVDPLK